MSRTRNLSEQGRDLFASGLSLTSSAPTSEGLSPRSQRVKMPSLNAFHVLEDYSDEEDEDLQELKDEEAEPLRRMSDTFSPKLSPSLSGISPRWEKQVKPRARPPKMQLDAPQPQIERHVSAGSMAGEDAGDVSMLSSMMVDTKGRRETRRSQHGSKANRFKALKQRLDSIAKRDEQRQEAKNRRSHQEYEETGVWEDDE